MNNEDVATEENRTALELVLVVSLEEYLEKGYALELRGLSISFYHDKRRVILQSNNEDTDGG